MLESIFTKKEIAEVFAIPTDAVTDLLEGKMVVTKADIDRLLTKISVHMKNAG